MATILAEALNATGMKLTIFSGGQSYVGLNVAGTWVGTVSFFGSTDGMNFVPLFVTPFASGTAVSSSTANGSWFVPVGNYLAIRVTFTRTSGTAIVTLAASTDSSYQDAFLATTSRWVSQSVSGGAANAITVAAQANRAWNISELVIGYSVAPAAAVLVTISDGASSVLWETYVPPLVNDGAATVGGTFRVPLPQPSGSDPRGGVTNTPGNSLVITLAAPGGSVVSKVNAKISAAA